MMEYSSKETNRVSDDELIDAHIAEVAVDVAARDSFGVISDAAARMIASQYHEGQTSALYTLASTGQCVDAAFMEAQRALEETEVHGDTQHTKWLQYLLVYIAMRQYEETDQTPVENWSRLWLHQPGGDL